MKLNKNITSILRYITGFLLGITIVVMSSYAATGNAGIGMLFERIAVGSGENNKMLTKSDNRYRFDGANIQDKTVTKYELKDKSVNTRVIIDNAITFDKFINESIKEEDLDDGAIINTHFENESITNNKIKNSTITTEKIENSTLIQEDFTTNIDVTNVTHTIFAQTGATTKYIEGITILTGSIEEPLSNTGIVVSSFTKQFIDETFTPTDCTGSGNVLRWEDKKWTCGALVVPVDGKCSAYGCLQGIDTLGSYNWQCKGLNGGKTDYCSKPDPTPGDSNPSDPNPSDPNPSDSNPGDSNPGDSNPSDPNPSDPNPGDSNPGDSNPSNPNPSDPNPSDPNPGDPNPGESIPDESTPGESTPSEPKEPREHESRCDRVCDGGGEGEPRNCERVCY